ncbi:hypothetical protein [Roseateles agri]|nr:hypothetical protein [Paucibacter sp. R3-3]
MMPRTRPARWLLLLPLALAHLLLALWLNGRHLAASRGAPPQALSIVRLDMETPRPPPPKLQPPSVEARLPLPVVVPIDPPRLDDAPPPPNAITPTQTATPRSAAAAEAARPAPLNLALPPAPSASQPWRNPALADPRANTQRADYAARMADTLGTDTSLREQQLSNGTTRFRQGTECVEVSESRIGNIDPFNNSMRPTPRVAHPCR